MKKIIPSLTLALAGVLVAPAMLTAAGGSSVSAESEAGPEQEAKAAYNRGLELRDKAWQLEEEAASLSGAEAAASTAKATEAFRSAAGEFRAAVEKKPDFHQAWSSLGYALRQVGEYEESLAAYDRALAIDPSYTEAIEYRGQAYLGLDRLEEAKSAYMQLFNTDRDRAAELMTAMKRWIEEHRSDAGDLSQEVIESFATWVEERSDLVAQVGTVAGLRRSW